MTLFIRKRQKCQSVNAQSHSQCLSSHHKITPHPVVCGILFVKVQVWFNVHAKLSRLGYLGFGIFLRIPYIKRSLRYVTSYVKLLNVLSFTI